MHSTIHQRFTDTQEAEIAKPVLDACVHCGLCNATCPTYLDLGDERDGPRGRIYLIKQLLETGHATRRTQRHLDRCLTCRSCETTCPSGVQYGRLLDVGRGILERDLRRSPRETLMRWLLKTVVPYRKRFALLLSLAQAARPILPRSLRAKVPQPQTTTRSPDSLPAARTMLVLEGCAQAAATPATNAAARRVFAQLGINLISAPQAGCCGALHYHLGDHEAGKEFMRANIDAWWPSIERGAEAVVTTASGCGTTIDEYGTLLADDPAYAEKAARISSISRDVVEILEGEDTAALNLGNDNTRYALHCPCTLQHGRNLGDRLRNLLQQLGLRLVPTDQQHLCCGSAGSYSVLEPAMATRLRDRKLATLSAHAPEQILTANVGCQLHLASGTDIGVTHWIEAVDAASASQAQRSK